MNNTCSQLTPKPAIKEETTESLCWGQSFALFWGRNTPLGFFKLRPVRGLDCMSKTQWLPFAIAIIYSDISSEVCASYSRKSNIDHKWIVLLHNGQNAFLFSCIKLTKIKYFSWNHMPVILTNCLAEGDRGLRVTLIFISIYFCKRFGSWLLPCVVHTDF